MGSCEHALRGDPVAMPKAPVLSKSEVRECGSEGSIPLANRRPAFLWLGLPSAPQDNRFRIHSVDAIKVVGLERFHSLIKLAQVLLYARFISPPPEHESWVFGAPLLGAGIGLPTIPC